MELNLSEDEIKVLLHIIDQLNFKLPDAKIVQGIVDKLTAHVKEPNLSPPDKVNVKDAKVIEGEVVTPTP